MRTRRLVAVASAAVMTIAVVAGCAPSSSSGSDGASGDKVTLSVWSWRTEDAEGYRKIFDKFEAKHPNITVEFKPFKNTEYGTVLATALSGSDGPDLAQLHAYQAVTDLADAKKLTPLTDADVPSLHEAFSKDDLDAVRGTDGQVYAVPVATQTLQVIYNKKIFSDNGLTAPTTWPELIALSDTLTAKKIVPFAMTGKDDWMLPVTFEIFGGTRYGGIPFQEGIAKGQKKLTDPDFVAALEVMPSLKKYFPNNLSAVSYTDSQLLFTTGKAAMFPGGLWELGYFKQQNPALDMGVLSLPAPPGSPTQQPLIYGFLDGGYSLAAKSEHPEEAKKLLAWMATPEFGNAFMDTLLQMSPVKGVQPSDPLLAQIAKDYSANPAKMLFSTTLGRGNPTSNSVLSGGLQRMLMGKESAPAVAASVQRSVDQWFKPSN